MGARGLNHLQEGDEKMATENLNKLGFIIRGVTQLFHLIVCILYTTPIV